MAHDFDKKWRSKDVQLQENADFSVLLLTDRVLSGLTNAGFKKPSPIQLEAIPIGRFGKDLLVQAKSGTGKTLVFTIIALEMLKRKLFRPQVLILAPTREIAAQICSVVQSVGSSFPKLTCSSFIGGLPVIDDYEKALTSQIVVGTPGRIRQLIKVGSMPTNSIRLLVFDEADQLLHGTFKPEIEDIFNTLPKDKQVIATSATYPARLRKIIFQFLRDPHLACLNSTDLALLGIVHYAKVTKGSFMPILSYKFKLDALEQILKSLKFSQCLVFCNGIARVEVLCKDIKKWGFSTTYMSSAKEQCDRLKAIDRLKHFKCKVLVSSDVTSRGIDAENVDLVINFDLSYTTETYLHRVGRAGRYGSVGIAISLIAENQVQYLGKIESKGGFKSYKLTDPVPPDLIKNPSFGEFLIEEKAEPDDDVIEFADTNGAEFENGEIMKSATAVNGECVDAIATDESPVLKSTSTDIADSDNTNFAKCQNGNGDCADAELANVSNANFVDTDIEFAPTDAEKCINAASEFAADDLVKFSNNNTTKYIDIPNIAECQNGNGDCANADIIELANTSNANSVDTDIEFSPTDAEKCIDAATKFVADDSTNIDIPNIAKCQNGDCANADITELVNTSNANFVDTDIEFAPTDAEKCVDATIEFVADDPVKFSNDNTTKYIDADIIECAVDGLVKYVNDNTTKCADADIIEFTNDISKSENFDIGSMQGIPINTFSENRLPSGADEHFTSDGLNFKNIDGKENMFNSMNSIDQNVSETNDEIKDTLNAENEKLDINFHTLKHNSVDEPSMLLNVSMHSTVNINSSFLNNTEMENKNSSDGDNILQSFENVDEFNMKDTDDNKCIKVKTVKDPNEINLSIKNFISNYGKVSVQNENILNGKENPSCRSSKPDCKLMISDDIIKKLKSRKHDYFYQVLKNVHEKCNVIKTSDVEAKMDDASENPLNLKDKSEETKNEETKIILTTQTQVKNSALETEHGKKCSNTQLQSETSQVLDSLTEVQNELANDKPINYSIDKPRLESTPGVKPKSIFNKLSSSEDSDSDFDKNTHDKNFGTSHNFSSDSSANSECCFDSSCDDCSLSSRKGKKYHKKGKSKRELSYTSDTSFSSIRRPVCKKSKMKHFKDHNKTSLPQSSCITASCPQYNCSHRGRYHPVSRCSHVNQNYSGNLLHSVPNASHSRPSKHQGHPQSTHMISFHPQCNCSQRGRCHPEQRHLSSSHINQNNSENLCGLNSASNPSNCVPSEHRSHPQPNRYCDRIQCVKWYDMFYHQWHHLQRCANITF